MIRTAVVSGFVTVTTLLVACAHDHDRASTTAVTSGTPGGVRVTNVTASDYDAADRLAGELCRREATCGRIASGSDEAKLLGEQNCVTTSAPKMRAAIDGWACSASTHRAGFEDCLAAVRSERCETRIERPDILTACRARAVCGD